MEFTSVARTRRMVRNYDPDRPVPAAIRDRLMHTALTAPSAGFSQGWAFLVLESARDRDTFWTATRDASRPEDTWLRGMRRAPLLVVCFSDPAAYRRRYAAADKPGPGADDRWPVPYWHIDTGFAALLILLGAVDEGLGACFFGVPRARVGTLRAAFGVPDGFIPVGVVSVGYPAADHRSRSLDRGRRPPSEVVHYGSWLG